MPHQNKFSDRAHAENKLSVRTKFDSIPPPQNQKVVPLQASFKIAFQRLQRITDKLSVAHCALRVAPFTTSRSECQMFHEYNIC